MDWLREEALAAGADLRIGVDAEPDVALAEKPDPVVLAYSTTYEQVRADLKTISASG